MTFRHFTDPFPNLYNIQGVKSPKFGLDFLPQSSLSRPCFIKQSNIWNLKRSYRSTDDWPIHPKFGAVWSTYLRELRISLHNRRRKKDRKICQILNNSALRWPLVLKFSRLVLVHYGK